MKYDRMKDPVFLQEIIELKGIFKKINELPFDSTVRKDLSEHYRKRYRALEEYVTYRNKQVGGDVE